MTVPVKTAAIGECTMERTTPTSSTCVLGFGGDTVLASAVIPRVAMPKHI